MEKLGIAKEDLLDELKKLYHHLREELSFHVKIGAAESREYHMIQSRVASVKEKIAELEAAPN